MHNKLCDQVEQHIKPLRFVIYTKVQIKFDTGLRMNRNYTQPSGPKISRLEQLENVLDVYYVNSQLPPNMTRHMEDMNLESKPNYYAFKALLLVMGLHPLKQAPRVWN